MVINKEKEKKKAFKDKYASLNKNQDGIFIGA
jgi:hypothetical protein